MRLHWLVNNKGNSMESADFKRVNFSVWVYDIDGGFFNGGTSVTINLQNSNMLFIDKGNDRRSWPISTFEEGLNLARESFKSNKNSTQ